MPRFEFRLDRFLSVKEQIEDQKEIEYATALSIVEKEKAKLAELEQSRVQTVEDLRKSVSKKISPIEIRRYNNNIERLKHLIIVQTERLETAKLHAEEKRLELVEAMKDRKALETVKERNYEEYLKEEQKAERVVVDGLVSYQYSQTTKQKDIR